MRSKSSFLIKQSCYKSNCFYANPTVNVFSFPLSGSDMFSTAKAKSNTEPTDEASKIEGEFKKRIQNARNEIESRFIELYAKLSEEEMRLLTKLDEIESDTIQSFKKSSVALHQITKAREQILEIFRNNGINRSLLKKNLEIYDKEIEEIKTNSKISSSIKLNWKINSIPVSENTCEITILTNLRKEKHATVSLTDIEYLPYPVYHRQTSYGEKSSTEPLYGNIYGSAALADSSKWECQYCTTVNSMKSEICQMCYKTAGYKLQKKPLLPARIPVKYCRCCNAPNHVQNTNCIVCHQKMI